MGRGREACPALPHSTFRKAVSVPLPLSIPGFTADRRHKFGLQRRVWGKRSTGKGSVFLSLMVLVTDVMRFPTQTVDEVDRTFRRGPGRL